MFQFPANPALGQQFGPVQGVTYEWNGTGWLFLGPTTASLYPPGIVLAFAGASLTFQGWLFCDGKSYATSAQPALFAVIGYTYGGSGGNFNVPDLRGRVVAAPDAMGGTVAGRIGGSLAPHGAQLAAAGGAEVIALTPDQMPAHAHSITDVAHAHAISDPTHAHGVYDPGHAHSVYDPTHNHGVNDGGHAHSVSDPGHSHAYHEPHNSSGQNYAYQGGGPSALYSNTTSTEHKGVGISIAGAGANISIAGNGTGIGIYAAGTSTQIYGAGTGIGIAASGTGLSTTNNAGGNNWHFNMQPTLTLNYIIKA